jgi:hypothetical protein
MISEHDALSSYTIDVGRPVAHGAVTIGADVLPTDVIWENNEDVGFLVLRLLFWRCTEVLAVLA